MEYDKLFSEQEKEVNDGIVVSSLSEKIVSTAEKDFLHMNAEQEEREKEKKEIHKKIAEYRAQLRKCSNNKKLRMSTHNTQLSNKRTEIRKHIAALEMRLQEIVDEEKGSQVTGDQLVKNTKVGDDFTNMVVSNLDKI